MLILGRARGDYGRRLLKFLDPPSMGRGGGRAGRGAVRDVGLPSRQHSALLPWPYSRRRNGLPHKYVALGGIGGAVHLVVGGANGLAGGRRLRGRLCWGGA